MLENLFITYANELFRENLESFNKVFAEIHPHLTPNQIFNKRDFDFFLELIKIFSGFNDPKLANEYREEQKAKCPVFKDYFDAAYEANYRYREGFCPKKCIEFVGHHLARTAKKLNYGGDIHLKCIECRQFYFRDLLSKIIAKEEFEKTVQNYNKIHTSAGLNHYLRASYRYIRGEIILSEKGIFEKKDYVDAGELFGEASPVIPLRDRFDDFLTSLVGYSLTKFLLKNERSKLKNCQWCNNFFIASKNNDRQKYCSECSPKNKISKGKRKKYQREYRLKKKQKKIAKDHEARVKKFMKRTGYSRQEAIENIDADSKV